MSASRRPVTGSGKRALVALAMGAIASPLAIGLTAGPASAAVDIASACPEDAFDDAGFRDIGGQNAQFQQAINCLAALGITTGQTSTTFNPTGTITRVQLAQFLFRLGELIEFEWDTSDAGFRDIQALEGDRQAAINALRNEGVVRGTSDTTFNPLGTVRRDQMATFIAQFYENVLGDELPGTTVNAFRDDNGNIHEANINAIAAAEIADGVAPGLYGPERPVTRAQMAAFIARQLSVAVNEGLIEPPFVDEGEEPEEPTEPTEPTVAVGDNGNVTAGGNVAGTFTNLPEGATVTVTGAGITTAQNVTVGANGAFTVTLPAGGPTGAQTLTFVITTADGERIELTANITVAAPQTAATVRPELINAEIVSTNTADQAGNDGTLVRFTFDEEITGARAGGPDETRFHLYSRTGAQLTGDTTNAATIETAGNSALVFFADVTTTAAADEITLATVDFGAVTDNEGAENPIGDASLGDTSGDTTTGFQAGVTAAPDLVRLENFRVNPADNTQTLAEFVFDEAAFTVAAGGFSIVLLDGSEITGTAVAGQAGGQPGVNETADTTITVAFAQTAATGPITADEVARGLVQADTVSDAAQDANTPDVDGAGNPLQASGTPDTGTVDPDLVSAVLQFNADQTGGTTDTVVFTFDEAVLLSGADAASAGTEFFVYDVDGNEVAGDSAVRSTTNATQVVVTFADTEIDRAVGASVNEGAVIGQTGTANRLNEDDEVGTQNTRTGTSPGQTAGRTDNPDLMGIRLEANATTGAAEVVYVFDEDVQVVDRNEEFYLVQADGTRLVCVDDNATAGNEGTAAAPDNDNTVRCTQYAVADVAGNATADLATSAQVREAVVGSVDDDAVIGEADPTTGIVPDSDTATGLGNPEGAEAMSGGTGTPQQ